ncbi:MAG: SDR family NAD(P)-dependent oxidoreductase [Rhodovibrionaceae bacterium]|nr:SDR family NAD(P)-dependent oxidoreductase [Rhodovibrionaceae bacterium]
MTDSTQDAPATGRLAGRLTLVTGASRGIGRAVAKRFAAEGAHLILIARTKGALEELDDEIQAAGHPQPTLLPLNLRQFDQIDAMGASIYQRFGKLDVLVGNAGVLGNLSPVGHIPPKSWQEVIDVNLTANYRLLRSLDPLLRQSQAGRAIFVTSGVARADFAYFGAYAVSKAGLEKLVKTYAAEIGKTNVRANLLDPGVVRTSMRAQAFPGEDPLQHPEPEAITEAFVGLAEAGCSKNGEIVQA